VSRFAPALVALCLLPGCSREQWVLDAGVPLLRDQTACGFEPGRNPRDAIQARLEPGTEFTVRRRLLVNGQACWFIRTPEALEGWITFTVGQAHRIR
jgi:hypothetical protein